MATAEAVQYNVGVSNPFELLEDAANLKKKEKKELTPAEKEEAERKLRAKQAREKSAPSAKKPTPQPKPKAAPKPAEKKEEHAQKGERRERPPRSAGGPSLKKLAGVAEAPASAPGQERPRREHGEQRDHERRERKIAARETGNAPEHRERRPRGHREPREPREPREGGEQGSGFIRPKKRTFERHSGTGARAHERTKKGGFGAGNWGKPGDEAQDLKPESAAPSEEVKAEGEAAPAVEGEAAPAVEGEAAPAGEHGERRRGGRRGPRRDRREAEEPAEPEEEEKPTFTLDEYLSKQNKSTVALPPPRAANEGEDTSELAKMVPLVKAEQVKFGAKVEKKPQGEKKEAKTEEKKPEEKGLDLKFGAAPYQRSKYTDKGHRGNKQKGHRAAGGKTFDIEKVDFPALGAKPAATSAPAAEAK